MPPWRLRWLALSVPRSWVATSHGREPRRTAPDSRRAPCWSSNRTAPGSCLIWPAPPAPSGPTGPWPPGDAPGPHHGPATRPTSGGIPHHKAAPTDLSIRATWWLMPPVAPSDRICFRRIASSTGDGSVEGRRYRALEREIANTPGTFFFGACCTPMTATSRLRSSWGCSVATGHRSSGSATASTSERELVELLAPPAAGQAILDMSVPRGRRWTWSLSAPVLAPQ